MPCAYTQRDGSPCQFDDLNWPLYKASDGTVWCGVHLPLPDKQSSATWADGDRQDLANRIRGLPRNSAFLNLAGAHLPAGLLDNPNIPYRGTVGQLNLDDAIIYQELRFDNWQFRSISIRNTQLICPFTLQSIKCEGLALLSGSSYWRGLRLLGEFHDEIDLSNCRIKGHAVFHCQFKKNAIFRQTRFLCDTSFKNDCSFGGATDFESVRFRGRAKIHGGCGPQSSFNFDNAYFASALVLGLNGNHGNWSAKFGKAIFRKPTEIRNHYGTLEFEGARFFGHCNFLEFVAERCSAPGSSWKQGLRANDATIGVLALENANFSGPLELRGASLKVLSLNDSQLERVDCLGAGFSEALFAKGNAKFNEIARFTGSGVGSSFPLTIFDGATFSKEAFFDHRRFLDRCSFSGTTFGAAPSFDESTLHPLTVFPRLEDFKDTTSSYAYRRYQTLRQKCEAERSRLDEAMFHVLEQRSIRNTLKLPIWDRAFSWLYDFTSTYGTNVVRPLALFGISLVGFGGLYAWLQNPVIQAGNIDLDFVEYGVRQTLHNSFAPFFSLRDENSGLVVLLVGWIQSLISVGLIAVFLFALRWRFRRG